jgi:hypothetical protein
MDSLGAHMYICRDQGKRNEIRNPDHARLTTVLRRLCQSHSSLSMGLGEPHCMDYFQPSIVAGESESKQSHVVKEYTTYVKRRADIGVLDITMERPSILIDCTRVAPNAAYIKDYPNSGQAAELTTKRKVEYYSRHFDIADMIRVSLVIFAVETSGGLSQESKNFCKFLRGLSEKESSFHIQWIYQQIAVRIQTSRAQNVDLWRLKNSSDEQPHLPPVY